VPRVFGAEPFAGFAERLAGVGAHDAIQGPSEGSGVEGFKVSPDTSVRIQGSRFHRANQRGDAVSFSLHVQFCASAWNRQSEGEIAGSGAGTEAENAKGRIHIVVHAFPPPPLSWPRRLATRRLRRLIFSASPP
jgi:hypothetical protein